jgi:glycosyltransferase involved in cell wall biosynthesis
VTQGAGAPPARIGINAAFLEPGMGGLETYVRELTPRLAAAAPGSRITVVCNPRGRELLAAEPWAGAVALTVPRPLQLPATKAAFELTALGALASRRFDVLLNVALTAPFATRAANVVLLADVTWMVMDDLRDGGGATIRLWRTVVPPVARRADRVIALTESGAQDIAEHVRVPRERIDVIGLGYGSGSHVEPIPAPVLRAKLGLDDDGPVVLNVAAKKAHKNLMRLVEAMAIVRREQPHAQLVMPGAPTPYQDELVARAQALGIADAVVLPGFVDPEELEGLYALADCFAFPSINEGFGLPLLEAMVRDVPVVTSTTSAMPEVAGDAAVLVDPFSVEAIAGGIARVLGDPAERERLIAAGRRRPAAFTWERCAEQTLATLSRAHRDRRAR